MKNLLLLPLLAFLIGGCIKVEDAEDTNNQNTTQAPAPKPSSVIIKSNQDDFTLTWKKNTDGYGQLEITTDPSTPVKPMAYTDIVGEITIECKAQDQNNSQPQTVKEYECSGSPASMVGVYKINFALNKQYEIIQRSSKNGKSYTQLGIVGFTSK
jgi:hypothetical protein